jgi:hypothetical protein
LGVHVHVHPTNDPSITGLPQRSVRQQAGLTGRFVRAIVGSPSFALDIEQGGTHPPGERTRQ